MWAKREREGWGERDRGREGEGGKEREGGREREKEGEKEEHYVWSSKGHILLGNIKFFLKTRRLRCLHNLDEEHIQGLENQQSPSGEVAKKLACTNEKHPKLERRGR